MTARPKTKRGAARRKKILEAAEAVIGRTGFASSSIAAITQEADTALGTFYIYFSSKEAVFRELLLEMGQLTRRALTDSIREMPNRLEAEREGIRAFLEFVAARPSLYRIVEEARYIDPDAYRAYFSTFAAAYKQRLAAATAAGEIRAGDPEIRAWALMGIAKTLGERYVLWEDNPDIDHVVDEAFRFIRHGLEP
ncbi:TetR family transcriptional regulator [Pseudooceanicola lipolyticus]|uniref:TetR family transcriptional regulator n=1 Tax=Pseudooceanicola lipolyticus TaxID=2029104 RepID=A0A2M8IXR6_9RHOB|nr:TetR/AcrR family transcriptional regulator [Pseudooceanicola lipolyticus]PJE35326.1 TetR family transcriptional regulator [Pseudooceanicola lipolyticus]